MTTPGADRTTAELRARIAELEADVAIIVGSRVPIDDYLLAAGQRDRHMARVAELERENATLRAIAAKVMPCHYCGAKTMAECPSGFPGCALADDICFYDAKVSEEIARLRARIKELEQ